MNQNAKVDSAFERLRRDILNGTHAPGQALRLTALTERYGLRGISLKTMLQRMEKKNLVVSAPNRGWRVAPVSLVDFEDLLSGRQSLETALLIDAIEAGDADWEAKLVAAHYRLAQAVVPVGAADTQAYRQNWLALHDGFHSALIAGARSKWLKAIHADLVAQMHRHHQAVLSRIQSETQVQVETIALAYSVPRHTELMVAALDRDISAATIAVKKHSVLARDIYQNVLGDGAPKLG